MIMVVILMQSIMVCDVYRGIWVVFCKEKQFEGILSEWNMGFSRINWELENMDRLAVGVIVVREDL